MDLLPKDRGERLALVGVAILVLVTVGFLTPTALARLQPAPPAATPLPATPPPAAVLLPEELDQDVAGVVTLVNDRTFGTAFFIDKQGDLLTAAHLVSGSASLRVVDNTGGSLAVRVLGIDTQLDVAEVRVQATGTPLVLGDSSALHLGDAFALLASPKNASLPLSTPGVITSVGTSLLKVRADIHPGNAGGPIAGPGGKVLAIAVLGGENEVLDGFALPIERAQPDISAWQTLSGTLLPLAPLPSSLTFRGAQDVVPPSSRASIQSVQPARASAGQDTVLTLRGSGFVAGASLRVRFVPVASQNGSFDGLAVALANATTMTVKVPAGRAVQDYTVQLVNGDGAPVPSAATFTVTP